MKTVIDGAVPVKLETGEHFVPVFLARHNGDIYTVPVDRQMEFAEDDRNIREMEKQIKQKRDKWEKYRRSEQFLNYPTVLYLREDLLEERLKESK